MKNKLNELKKLVKSKYFSPALVLIILIIVAIFLYQMGFRITYAPELETNWDAVSAVAAWTGILVSVVGVVASFLAVWYAIQVPQKIADRQDKIALFEKRYVCFQLFEQCVMLLECSTGQKKDINVTDQCCYMLGVQKIEDLSHFDLEKKLGQYEHTLHEMEFLFLGIEEKDAAELFNSLSLYIRTIANHQDIEESKQRYIKAMLKFGKYVNEIWDTLDLSV